MKTTGAQPEGNLSVINYGGIADIAFRTNIEVSARDSDDNPTEWTWDEYHLHRPWRDMLETDIQASFDSWLESAKRQEEYDNPPDLTQMRADIDYLEITQSAMYGISLLALTGSDPDVLEKARKYYPARWDEPRLRMLVTMQKLSETDFQSITGIPFNEGGGETADAQGETAEPETAGESSSEIVG